jgi:molybdenum cofactor guanylyltransferase
MVALGNTMSRPRKSVTGFLLAGGSSRRMGQPKELLILGGETMVERQVRSLRAVAEEVMVIGWASKLSASKMPKGLRNLRIVPDDLPGRGPLGGIYTGLKQTRTEYNLFLSCDMPFVDAGFLEYLCRRALESQADVTVPKSHERLLNPLCAVYRRRALPAILASLNASEYKISRFFPRVRCDVIPRRDIARAGFAAMIFDNMSTIEDYEAAKRNLSIVSGQ